MRASFALILVCLLLTAFGCTATSNGEKPKIYCPACGTELDTIYHKHF